tara:strand:- start:291 stop:812 length:522 start_codon:yes stop_codon:yes gene_type:complete
MRENFKTIKMFPLPFGSKIPIELQYKIITEGEEILYNKSSDIIIKWWYNFINKKIIMTNIALKFKKEIREFSDGRYEYFIDPYKIENELKYIEKHFTGTEDIDYFWGAKLEGIAKGLSIIKHKDNLYASLSRYNNIKDILLGIREKILERNSIKYMIYFNARYYLWAPTFMGL